MQHRRAEDQAYVPINSHLTLHAKGRV